MENVLYLEEGDLNLKNWSLNMENLNRINRQSEFRNLTIRNGIPIVIFIYGNFCGYCHKMMPEFQEFANSAGIYRTPGITSPSPKGNVIAAAICIDGNPREQALGKAIQKTIPGFRGVPTVIKIQNGNMTVYKGERRYQDLVEFINQ